MADTPTPTPTPSLPLIKKISLTPIQQRIKAVNDDNTLSFALHGEINRVIQSLSAVTNYNADTLTLIIEALRSLGIVITRLTDVEKAQQAASKEAALISSYTDPTVTMSAQTQADGTATVTIISHNRVYADTAKTTVPINGATITGLALNSQYYVYYDQPSRAGGTVSYQYTLDNTVAAQTNNRHSLGGVATGGADDMEPLPGGGVDPPGVRRIPAYKRLIDDEPQPEQ